MTDLSTNSGERALDRMRRYTTVSLVIVIAMFLVMAVLGSVSPVGQIVSGIAGVLVIAQTVFWEKGPPLWLGIATLVVTYAIWLWSLSVRDIPFSAVFLACAIAQQVTYPRQQRTWLIVAGGLVVAAPLAIAALIDGTADWNPWLITAIGGYVGAVGFFQLNNYAFGLYLEIDAARLTSAELAVAQERYRFAADLHDIQGHTLHVIRLKTRLAVKLMEKDADAARDQLLEADELIGETLANTRSLAFGDRYVGLAAELANARELFSAAGIDCTVAGSPALEGHILGTPDELLGLVMRETTTNILRHSQATTVTVTLDAGSLTIVNDGSPASTRPLSGLARLGERFAAVGGTLTTSESAGMFTTRAVVA
ncbi:MAG: sensor histidine kinase [Rhodoglobus sp.]